MKFSLQLASIIVAFASALPTDITYGPPKGGWESIDWTKIDYPKGTGADAVPKGGWNPIPSPPSSPSPSCPPPNPPSPFPFPFTFTSTFTIHATPAQVVNNSNIPTGGLQDTYGLYLLGLDATTNTICYNITLYNYRGEYSSPARTATHLHEARVGLAGPPRIAFMNPVELDLADVEGESKVRRSVGCLTGPFVTGLNGTGANAGVDTGSGFHVSRIEKDPEAFFVDVHSSLAVPGAVRGQVA